MKERIVKELSKLGWQIAVTLLISVNAGIAYAEAEQVTSDNEKVVREFIAAWSNLDVDELVGYFAEDGTYYNMPITPVTGRDNLHGFIKAFLASWEKTDWEITNLLADGDLVMVERVDRTTADGRKVELPCLGVFEMENGKIKVWRDYFDMATFTNAMTAEKEE
jgi:limonene-1,2-epoxide hydrolase